MAFYIARVMREYGRSYWDVLSLGIKTFWSLNRQVNRLRAEHELRTLRLSNAANNQEAATALRDDLVREIESPVVLEKKFDAAKFEELQAQFSKQRMLGDTHKVE